jgi:hypothetical protein
VKFCYSIFILFIFLVHLPIICSLDIEKKHEETNFSLQFSTAYTLTLALLNYWDTIQKLTNEKENINNQLHKQLQDYCFLLQEEKQQVSIDFQIFGYSSLDVLENIKQEIKNNEHYIKQLQNYFDDIDKNIEVFYNNYNSIVSNNGENPLLTFIANWFSNHGLEWIKKPIGPQGPSLFHYFLTYFSLTSCLEHLIQLDPTIVNEPDSNGNYPLTELYPLEIAYLKGNNSIIELLLRYKAHFNPRFEKVLRCIEFLKQLPPYICIDKSYKTLIQQPITFLLHNMYHNQQEYGNLDQKIENYCISLQESFPYSLKSNNVQNTNA